MFFPWSGLLEQIRLCDNFVFYDDAQYARGFFNRVQIKSRNGVSWLSVPLKGQHRGQLINEVRISEDPYWRRKHRESFRHQYSEAPNLCDALGVLDEVYSEDCSTLADLARSSTMSLVKYFGLDAGRSFCDSSSIPTNAKSTQRLVDICLKLKTRKYLTGHGARNYLEHELFEENDMDVCYIEYGCPPREQLHGDFTPYVSALDLVANHGKAGLSLLKGSEVHWKEFL
tara:strand:- start:4876 stop:5559 length:684 start_codon:yes stop_codon:yes gene_type:complete